MFGGYDPAYNPESLEKAKAENKELSPQQQEMADRWAATMDNHGVESEVAQAAAETAVATGDPNAATEIVAEAQAETAAEQAPEQPTEEEGADFNIPETEPRLQGQKLKGTDAKPGQDVNRTDPDTTIDNMKTLTPAGAVVADAVNDAITITEQSLNEGVGINQFADFVDNVHAAAKGGDVSTEGDGDDTEGEGGEEESPEQQATTPASTEIQHFSASDSDTSEFQPLPPDQQRAQAQAVVEMTRPDGAMIDNIAGEQRNDSDNLVAQAVAENSGDGSINLNSVGGKLEGDGVDISNEVSRMSADIANDVAAAGTDGSEESLIAQEAVADNLAVDAAATALAVKEQAADTISAIKNGSETADTEATDFTQAASELDSLIDTAESTAVQAGQDVSKNIAEARKLSDEAKNAVSEAQAEADAEAEAQTAEESGEDSSDGDEEEHSGGDDEFNSDNYPELKDLEKGDRQSIFA